MARGSAAASPASSRKSRRTTRACWPNCIRSWRRGLRLRDRPNPLRLSGPGLPYSVPLDQFDAALPLELDKPAGAAAAPLAQVWPDAATDDHPARFGWAAERGGRVDGVAPQIEDEVAAADHARHHRSQMDADPHAPSGLQFLSRRRHLQAAPYARQRRFLDVAQQPGGGDESVSHDLDLLQAMANNDLIIDIRQRLQMGDRLLGRIPVAVGREAHDIAEHHDDVLEPTRHDRAGRP